MGNRNAITKSYKLKMVNKENKKKEQTIKFTPSNLPCTFRL